mmetsp:Transcript_20859/g.36664  ORF Transcript_20859/g.36664 Transcript_20859/m.36664 type:complete len:82 (+) Transcript_20859:367-612(+)
MNCLSISTIFVLLQKKKRRRKKEKQEMDRIWDDYNKEEIVAIKQLSVMVHDVKISKNLSKNAKMTSNNLAMLRYRVCLSRN